MKQGILLDPATLGITPPVTTGYSQVYLVEVQYADSDTGSTVLPYYNASNPAAPFSGPGNAGTAQNTIRKGIVAVQIKAGTAAPTGTQVAPTADAGWTGLFAVTVANGQSTITSGNIATLASAPFLPVKLPQIPTAIQNSYWVFATAGGTSSALTLTLSPAPSSLVAGFRAYVTLTSNIASGATINVNGLGAKAIVYEDGTAVRSGDYSTGSIVPIMYDGTNMQLAGQRPGTQAGSAPKLNYFELSSNNTQSVATSTITKVTDFVVSGSQQSDASFSGGTVTIGTLTAGVWVYDQQYYPSQTSGTAASVQAYLYKNGVQQQNQTVAGTFCSNTGTIRVAAGDTLDMRVWQNSGFAQKNVGPGSPSVTVFNLYQVSS
jgi:hypothetical protein